MTEEPKESLTGYEIIVYVFKEWWDKMDDSVVLVRCKDCKYNPRNPRPYDDNDETYAYVMCGHLNGGENGFCSNGKRREERKE